jgi:poly-gamma-glutamate synthesis protein (capsule biosynthesis protein)
MRGRGVAAQIAAAGTGGLFSPGVRDCFASADLALLNLDCCGPARNRRWRGRAKPFCFRAPLQAVGALTGLASTV